MITDAPEIDRSKQSHSEEVLVLVNEIKSLVKLVELLVDNVDISKLQNSSKILQIIDDLQGSSYSRF